MTKILLIENDLSLRENTCKLLELHGFECITAEHGKIGLEKVLSEKPDLIICDIMDQHLNGYQIKEALNNLNEHAQIPFIFLSAKVENVDVKKEMDLRAEDFITKPFRIAELIISIKNRLQQSKHIYSKVKETDLVNDFIYLAKKECNKPLDNIINLSDTLIKKYPNPPDFLEKALIATNKSGKSLHKTLNNLIDLVRIKHYNKSAEEVHSLMDMKNIIQQTLSERAHKYNYFGKIKTKLNFQDLMPFLEEDLKIIIFELIDNMFKFSSSNNVEVSLNLKTAGYNKWMILTIINSLSTPLSFSLKDVKPFKQYPCDKKSLQGSGLGLHLVVLIVEKYLGTIEIDTSNLLLFRLVLTFPLPQIDF